GREDPERAVRRRLEGPAASAASDPPLVLPVVARLELAAERERNAVLEVVFSHAAGGGDAPVPATNLDRGAAGERPEDAGVEVEVGCAVELPQRERPAIGRGGILEQRQRPHRAPRPPEVRTSELPGRLIAEVDRVV